MKRQRATEVNAVILAISTHGRRFFWNAVHQRVAFMDVGDWGHIYFTDDYSGKRVYVSSSGRWPGFTHGGTMRRLVELFAEYIRHGHKLPIDYIGLQRNSLVSGDIWGYGAEAVDAVRAAVRWSPVFALNCPSCQHQLADADICRQPPEPEFYCCPKCFSISRSTKDEI
jgi:hypothetical protein